MSHRTFCNQERRLPQTIGGSPAVTGLLVRTDRALPAGAVPECQGAAFGDLSTEYGSGGDRKGNGYYTAHAEAVWFSTYVEHVPRMTPTTALDLRTTSV